MFGMKARREKAGGCPKIELGWPLFLLLVIARDVFGRLGAGRTDVGSYLLEVYIW
jgi:hypothetical protein